MGVDRRQIAPLLVEHFPTMAGAPSDEWHGFLNAMTGLNIGLDEPNPTAFDKWRQALAAQHGLPVWGYTKEKIDAIKAKGEELKAKEIKRREDEAQTLKTLAAAAPTKTAKQLIDDTKAANK